MRFMIIRKADAETEAGVIPTEKFFAAMGRYSEEMGRAGILLQAEGLQASLKRARLARGSHRLGNEVAIDRPRSPARDSAALRRRRLRGGLHTALREQEARLREQAEGISHGSRA